MRSLVFIFLILVGLATTHAQSPKPRIVGQRELSTGQGKSIAIQLTDLYVEETFEQSDNEGGNGGNNDGQDENDGDNESDEKENEDDEDGDDDKKNDKDDKDKNKDKDKKDEKKDNDGKGKGKDKGKGNGRNRYPDGYALELFPGDNYSFSASTVTPEAGFTGVLSVPVQVRNSDHTSPTFLLKITVLPAVPANVRPVITGQAPLSTPMNNALEVKLSHLTVTDPDDQYPEGFTITLRPGERYSIGGHSTIVPATGFVGTLKVPVVVNDGAANSEPFQLMVSVTPQTSDVNIPPKISGQLPLSISVNQSVTIVPTHLLVDDPDSDFPEDFTVKVYPREGYKVNNTTVTPPPGFSGVMWIDLSVSDGKMESAIYQFKITVDPAMNLKPVITGQAGIKVPAGQPLEIKLSHLVVEDSDNNYPGDFQLTVHQGQGYSISAATITPAAGFLGILKVIVSVNDGKASSDPFELKVEVISNDRLEILGQMRVETVEDSSVVIGLRDLVVNDPSLSYPEGFGLRILDGENYKVSDNRIEPHKNYFGNLTVPVAIAKGNVSSQVFGLLIRVNPVNDPPALLHLDSDPIEVTGGGSWPLFNGIAVEDVDDTHLVYAEITFDEGDYIEKTDRLECIASDSIHVVFDRQSGTLFMVGIASLSAYGAALRSVTYLHDSGADSLMVGGAKTVRAQLSDGKRVSELYTRVLTFDTDLALEIPTAFTPNNDYANDTWKITPVKNPVLNAFIRVYDKRGHTVFECRNFETEWDGRLNGNPLPPDVYFYTIELDLSHRKVSFKGIVSILR